MAPNNTGVKAPKTGMKVSTGTSAGEDAAGEEPKESVSKNSPW